MNKKLVLTVVTGALLVLVTPLKAQPSFAVGADVSWVTEMEADGKRFYDANGTETDLFQLLSDLKMNSIRLRVWVNPETAYGPWCNKADVVAKAKRAHALGMSVMIDFHYSDFFTDPSRQTLPAAWADLSFEELKTAIASHTTEVLQALQAEGIEPAWVQVGNETRAGMLWPSGQLTWGSNINTEWKNYAALSNAGYDAVKEVMPDVPVIVHLNNAQDDNLWWFQAFQKAGGKLDMVGLSHYPTTDGYGSENSKAITYIQKLSSNLRLPIMIVEVGMPSSNAATAYTMMKDFYTKLKSQNIVKGIFYWEPEVYNYWKPAYYSTLGWNAYSSGAFTTTGRPDRVLKIFTLAAEDYADANAIEGVGVGALTSDREGVYDLSGRRINGKARTPGIYITNGKKILRK